MVENIYIFNQIKPVGTCSKGDRLFLFEWSSSLKNQLVIFGDILLQLNKSLPILEDIVLHTVRSHPSAITGISFIIFSFSGLTVIGLWMLHVTSLL